MALSAWLLELVYARAMAKGHDAYKAESRLICAFPGAFCVTAGLFIYGFSAGRTHFMVVSAAVVAYMNIANSMLLANHWRGHVCSWPDKYLRKHMQHVD